MDIWRHLNPLNKEFSCYSSTYKSYSRRDNFLVSAELLSNITGSHYNSKIVSDRLAISMIYVEPKLMHQSTKWRFQEKRMQDSFLGEQMDIYFKLSHIRWEPFKAFIRGQIISYMSSRSRETQEKIRDPKSNCLKMSFQEGLNKHEISKQLLALRT